MIRIARPGPGERLAPDHPLGHPELLADPPHLVLEQEPQRLDEAHPHVLGQPADVVVRLDRRRDALGAARLDHVGVERALHEPAHVAELPRLLLEDADELAADDLPLLLRLLDAVEQLEEPLLRLDVDERDVEVLAERLDDLLRLVLAQQAVVDEDARELLADRLVHEQRGDRRVDAARQRAQHALASRPARGSAPPAPRSPRPASRRAARRRRGRGSSSARPSRAACGRPRGGTGRRTARARAPRTRPPASRASSRRRARPRAPRRRCRGATSRPSAPQACRRAAATRRRASACARTPRRRCGRRGRRARAPSAARRSRCRASGSRARTAPGRSRGASSE